VVKIFILLLLILLISCARHSQLINESQPPPAPVKQSSTLEIHKRMLRENKLANLRHELSMVQFRRRNTDYEIQSLIGYPSVPNRLAKDPSKNARYSMLTMERARLERRERDLEREIQTLLNNQVL
jgi:hypothetical protein